MADEDLALEGAGEENALAEDALDTGAEDTVEVSTPSLEDLASEMGWRPQDQWKGDPTNWKPADQFLRTTVDVNKGLNTRLKGLEETISRMARTSAAMTEQALAKQRDELLAARREAIDMGDHEAVERVDAGLRKIESIAPEPDVPPETREFLARNAWMNTDPEAAAWAQNRAGELGRQGIGPARQLAIVEREAKQLFPEHFETKQERQPAKGAPLNQPGNRGGKPAAKGFSSLPPDVQSAALDYEKRGICTKDAYAKMYYEENA